MALVVDAGLPTGRHNPRPLSKGPLFLLRVRHGYRVRLEAVGWGNRCVASVSSGRNAQDGWSPRVLLGLLVLSCLARSLVLRPRLGLVFWLSTIDMESRHPHSWNLSFPVG